MVVIDDGSSDGTGAVSLAAGADSVIRHAKRRGLARAFQTGIDHCLESGAQVLVNIDADGQYDGQDIPNLVSQILSGDADLVIGDRQIGGLQHFTSSKRTLQKLGSWVVQKAAGVQISDAVSGFRAYSADAASRIFATARFSYTVETLIQAGKQGLAVSSIPIRANPTPRPSRLHNGSVDFILRQTLILIRTYITYEPLKTFATSSSIFGVIAFGLLGRVAIIAATEGGIIGHVQSLLVGLVSLMIFVLLLAIGIIADRILEQRLIMEAILSRIRKTTHTD